MASRDVEWSAAVLGTASRKAGRQFHVVAVVLFLDVGRGLSIGRGRGRRRRCCSVAPPWDRDDGDGALRRRYPPLKAAGG